MIPIGFDNNLELDMNSETIKTYKLTQTNIQGYTDNLDALQQAIYKVLNTEKYEYEIYSFNYGIELENLIGKDEQYVKIELKRRITECLIQNEKIQAVDNFNFTITNDNILCVFDVSSIYGKIQVSKEVNI